MRLQPFAITVCNNCACNTCAPFTNQQNSEKTPEESSVVSGEPQASQFARKAVGAPQSYRHLSSDGDMQAYQRAMPAS